jgi:methyl-accepting chemotaxis protein
MKMNLKKINVAVRVTIPALLLLLIIMLVVLVNLINTTSHLREQCADLVAVSNDMLHNNNQVIKLAKKYFVDFDEGVLKEYEALINDTSTFDTAIELLNSKINDDEKEILGLIQGSLDKLEAFEIEAFDAYEAGDEASARSIITGNDYTAADNELVTQVHSLISAISERYDNEVGETVGAGMIVLVVVGSILIVVLILLIPMMNWVLNKLFWYAGILDSVPLPLNIIDMNLKSTFINKSTETMLGVSRDNVLGKKCAEIWNAGICNTDECGARCLDRGKSFTEFDHGDMSFRVDTSYITNLGGKKIGYVEVVQDITSTVKAKKRDEELIKNVGELSEAFVSSSLEIANGSQSIAQGSTEQAASVEELSASISEVEEKTKTNADMAENASTLSNEIKLKAERGSQQMDGLMAAVQEISDASGQIEKVIKVIDDIAFQTNILALNAAVEAARAGSAGKGFAVVAEEVRNLASKSAEAAKNTSGLIENSINKSNHGMELATETSSSLKEIVDGINQNAEIISSIAQSSEEQASAIGQINTGIEQVANVVQQNSATSEESAAASSEMSRQAGVLENLLTDFKN